MPAMVRKGFLAAGLVVTAIAASAGTVQAAVTIGSNLADPFATNAPGCNAGLPCTATNLALPATSVAANGLTSPVNGTVTSWRAAANTGNQLSLQVLRPVSGSTYTGVATSAPVNFAGPISSANPTSMPIQIGDGVGLLNPNQNLIFAMGIPDAAVAVWYLSPDGTLDDGSTRPADVTQNFREVLVQATIEPTNTVAFGAIARNKKKGTATVTVSVPNQGQLSNFLGAGVTVTGPASVAAPGDVQLAVRAFGEKLKKLKHKGKVGVSFNVTFTPSGGIAGGSVENLTLRKKLKKK
jgi:hypothetical protein